MRKSDTGRRGEELALAWLLERGFRLLDRNWRSRHKEIDLLMERDGRLHVIEVKTLTAPMSAQLAIQPFEKVDGAKRRNLAEAARRYAAEKRFDGEIQFDIVSVILDGDQARVDYIPEAFFPIWNRL